MNDIFSDPSLPVQIGYDAEEWRNFFSRYSQIILVANSDEVDIDHLKKTSEEGVLFIFFNKVYKVLDGSFDRPAILVCRSGMMGANIVHRREVPEVLKYFNRDTFLGIINIAISPEERFSPAEAFEGASVKHLHLGAVLSPFYPEKKLPTTGFGLALWLRGLGIPARIRLAGFSSRRSERWKVFDVHDWTFEQVALRLFHRSGDIELMPDPGTNPYIAFQNEFPQFSHMDIALTANEVGSERLMMVSSTVDRLMSVTKILRFLDNSFRKIRPKTRKQRFLQRNK
ncbi:MAG TPA: hypothetical protein VNQ78_17370 [Paracoccus sp. (in: a-proteobacteria)]|uniref:hypothetical protein n=1 Tax=Paracoccus sp. TaxID=267 RepID=UPI002C9AA6DD|nr:hypothetical protein [Paracoccus sp. (in: a-proteobacteria)]HWL58432.1 hypothetical protein [Paracoccus sp. (in: a-proteobacteria)]